MPPYPAPPMPADPRPARSAHDSEWWDAAFALLCVAVFGGLLYAASATTFFADAWSFITATDRFSFEELMRPHNEHWMLGHKLIYGSLLELFGLATYQPFLVRYAPWEKGRTTICGDA